VAASVVFIYVADAVLLFSGLVFFVLLFRTVAVRYLADLDPRLFPLAFVWLFLALCGFKFDLLTGGRSVDVLRVLSTGAFTNGFTRFAGGLVSLFAIGGYVLLFRRFWIWARGLLANS
jgi:hypothetical protein